MQRRYRLYSTMPASGSRFASAIHHRRTGSFSIAAPRPAGLRVGDEILGLDDAAASGVSLGELRSVLQSREGRALKVDYRRDGIARTVSITLSRMR